MRILLVEDEEKVVRFLTLGLKAERFATDVASDGQIGLNMALATRYDLLIVDLMLPGLTGTQLISRLRRHDPGVPIIVLTARDAVDDKVLNFDVLRRGNGEQSNVITLDGLEMNRLSHQVKRNGLLIKLTSKEYSLLEYLAVNAGRVLSRTMIVEHVWDQSFEGLTNIVDVYIRQLRAKVDEPFKTKLIHTVRNMGYMISDEYGD